MLHLDMNLVWNIVNIIVLYLLLRHFLIKPVTGIMNKRQAMVDQSIANARDSENKASELRLHYEEKMAAASAEGKKLIEEAKEQAKTIQERMIAEAGEQAGRIIKEAHESANAEQEKAMREARTQIAALVLAAAAKVLSEGSDAAGNQLLYDKFLAKAGVSDESSFN